MRRTTRAFICPAPYLLITALLASQGCRQEESPIVHIVVIWLTEPGNAAHRRVIMEETRKLAAIPGVSSLSVGTAIESDRPIVNDSFDVAITMTFPSVAAMNRYLKHPDHVSLVKTKLMPLVDKIRVYDFNAGVP